ncbi:MAG: hypothetical protein R3220_12115, partial [Balneolaceae bacterium]|nr:hypothetical protein [Balneolaceae bacterium]
AFYHRYVANKLLMIIGILSMIWGYLFYWILNENFVVYSWAWGLANTTGMILSVYSFSDLLNQFKTSEL